jgi:hypothetical protein
MRCAEKCKNLYQIESNFWDMLRSKCTNVTKFKALNYSHRCVKIVIWKKKHIAKGVVVKSILSKEFNSRGQIDLMDFQSNSDQKPRSNLKKRKFAQQILKPWQPFCVQNGHHYDNYSVQCCARSVGRDVFLSTQEMVTAIFS